MPSWLRIVRSDPTSPTRRAARPPPIVILPSEATIVSAMQIVSHLLARSTAWPRYVDADSIPPAELEEKRRELESTDAVQKKPENLRPQIVEGQLKKWYKEVCLLEQPFRDEERSVRDLVTERIATIGENIRVRRFTRYALGEEL